MQDGILSGGGPREHSYDVKDRTVRWEWVHGKVLLIEQLKHTHTHYI